jgi:ligand-binding sensor domain-containing protein/signal transduction histidine kinase
MKRLTNHFIQVIARLPRFLKIIYWVRQLKVVLGILIALGFMLGWRGSAAAQDGQLRFDRLTVEDGLSQNTVHAILQDRMGFMWFATEDGLDRYDGYNFTVYRHNLDDPDSLSSSDVYALFEDQVGRFWVGTGAGLDRLDRETGRFIHYSSENGIPSDGIQALAEDGAGRLWVGTQQHGLWLLEPDNGGQQQIRYLPDEPGALAGTAIYDILRDRSGGMWVATDEGLKRFDPQGNLIHRYRSQVTDPNSPSSNSVQTLWEDRQGNMWIGTDGGGLNQLDPHTGLFTFYLHSNIDSYSLGDNQVWDILEDGQGALWLATQRGLNRFDRENGRFTHYLSNPKDPFSLSTSTILSLYQDRSGVVWIGTHGGGVSQYKPSAHKFELYRADLYSTSGMSGNSISAILEDGSVNLWVGTAEAGLNMLERENGAWMAYRRDASEPGSLSSDNISALAQDRDGSLWIGTSGGGLNRLDPQTGTISLYRNQYGEAGSLSSNVVSSLLIDHTAALWVGTLDAGLNRLDANGQTFVRYRHDPQDDVSLSDDGVTVMLEAADGGMWVGTFGGGLDYFDPATHTFHHYRHEPEEANSLSSNRVYSLAESPAGVLWIGTQAGLNRFDIDNGTFSRITSLDGLPSDIICGVLAGEQGELWISTTNGLARFDPNKDAVRVYTTEDGLQSREFNPGAYFQSSQGEMFFGGVLGLNAFFPEQVLDQLTPPSIVITAFMIQNQTVLKDFIGQEPIELTYQDDFISFEFTALDFNAPPENRYAYKMDGFDEQWIEAGTRNYASYTNLPGGSYTFRIKAANSDGTWNEEGLAVPIHVRPPLWEMTWFWVATLFVVTGASFAAYRWRLHSIQRRNLELEQKVAELSQQVQETAVLAERNRLARNLHDSVTQSLYSLTLLTEAGLRMIEAGKLGELKENQGRLGAIAHRALQEMRLMVYELRPLALEQTGLAGALERRLEAVERRAGVQARLIVEGELKISQRDEEELYYLAQEALNNALKHAGASSVKVHLQALDGCVSLEIKDDGRGFDSSQIKRREGIGLASMRERAEKIGGKLVIESAPGSGTCIRFSNFPE